MCLFNYKLLLHWSYLILNYWIRGSKDRRSKGGRGEWGGVAEGKLELLLAGSQLEHDRHEPTPPNWWLEQSACSGFLALIEFAV